MRGPTNIRPRRYINYLHITFTMGYTAVVPGENAVENRRRRAAALAVALAAGALLFALSARHWGRTEERRVRVKFDDRSGPRLLRLEGAGDRPEYVSAPADLFREAREGDSVRCTVRRIPEFEVESAEFRLSRDGREIGRWSEGGPFFWIACAGLSLLAGFSVVWLLGLALLPWFPRRSRPALGPPTRLIRTDEPTPFAH